MFIKNVRKVAVENLSVLVTQLSAAVHTSQEYMCVKLMARKIINEILCYRKIYYFGGRKFDFVLCVDLCSYIAIFYILHFVVNKNKSISVMVLGLRLKQKPATCKKCIAQETIR